MRRLLLTALIALPGAALAAGSGSSNPPTQSNTTTECKNGKVWSVSQQACVNPQSGSLDDDTLYGAAREFAYAGMYDDALGTLAGAFIQWLVQAIAFPLSLHNFSGFNCFGIR